MPQIINTNISSLTAQRNLNTCRCPGGIFPTEFKNDNGFPEH